MAEEYQHAAGTIAPDEMQESSQERRAWLITWNRNNWLWEDYEEICASTKRGETFFDSWACANSSPRIGDEVFLLKVGAQPRGIVGHGTVEQALHEKAHYDAKKAAEGKKIQAIGVRFDRLIDYRKEKYISQSELNEKCAGQYWSPHSSGIEIKKKVLPALRMMWGTVTKNDSENSYWPSAEDYPVNLTKEDWKRFLLEVEQPKHKGCMRVLACFVDIGGTASPKTLSDKYKGHPSVYIGSVVNTGRRALNYFHMEPCPDGDTQRVFPIAFLGHIGTDVNPGSYEYTMRQELMDALKEMDLSDIELTYGEEEADREMVQTEYSHNMILYGPPGTGKTYNSINYAVAICEGRSVEEVMAETYKDVHRRYNELREQGRIVFTTFHQSYGYEEFIEGIHPVMAEDDNAGKIQYEIRDGIFKQICNAASTPDVPEINHSAAIWFVWLKTKGDSDLKQECFKKGEIRFEGPEDPQEGFTWEYDRLSRMSKGDFVITYYGGGRIIDGVGIVQDNELMYDHTRSSYKWVRKVKWLLSGVQIDVKPINNNHGLPNFMVSAMNHMKLSDLLEVVKENGGQQFQENSKPYILIID